MESRANDNRDGPEFWVPLLAASIHFVASSVRYGPAVQDFLTYVRECGEDLYDKDDADYWLAHYIKLFRRYVGDDPIRPDPTYHYSTLQYISRCAEKKAVVLPSDLTMLRWENQSGPCFTRTEPGEAPRKLRSSGLLERNTHCSKWPETAFPKTAEYSVITRAPSHQNFRDSVHR